MNKPKFRAWDKVDCKIRMVEELCFDSECVTLEDFLNGKKWHSIVRNFNKVILMQYSDYNDEENLDEIWESDLLEIESPKGKFIAEVVKENGTMGMVAVKGCIVDYFTDHWNDHFMPLIDLYWNENGDDGCLPKSKRLGSKYENPELLNEVE